MQLNDVNPVAAVDTEAGPRPGVTMVSLPHRVPIFTVTMPTRDGAEHVRELLLDVIKAGGQFR